MLSLNPEFTISNMVEGILDSTTKPENYCVGIKAQEEYNYLVPEKYDHLLKSNDSEEFDPIFSARTYHNFIFYSPSNYMKVFYNCDNSMSLTSMVNYPFELTSDHDSAWRHDGFVHMKYRSSELLDSLKSRVYNAIGIEIDINDVSTMNMVENCSILNIEFKDFMDKISRSNRMSKRLFFFTISRKTKILNLNRIEECKYSE